MAGKLLAWSMLLSVPLSAVGKCPGYYQGTPPKGHAPVPWIPEYEKALDKLDWRALVKDLEHLFTDSQVCWPADFGNYGPFFVRLAWHCSGTYRATDGRGGCGGGRQRFEPEASWEDNTNLDHARALLAPIKEKYGDQLSWGDLFVTAGTVAIQAMSGPVSQYCFGRIDDPDGTSSLDLGPSTYQEAYAPCKINGQCKEPLGTTTVGLIYVNPEGPVALDADGKYSPNPNPAASAPDVRDAFSRMGMNDTETVALIGGGHAFGKVHGACPNPPCGSGMGNDTFTSGFEGTWTNTPTRWSNEYFKGLVECEWEKHLGPGGHYQWRIPAGAPAKCRQYEKTMRLTTDVALTQGGDEAYVQLSKKFAEDIEALDEAFAAAWFKLTTRGGRWAANKVCYNADVSPDYSRPALRR